MSFERIWNADDEREWNKLLWKYWQLIKIDNIQLEYELNRIGPKNIERLSKTEWYEFLLKKYFKWKYTAPNRYASTTKHLRKYKQENRLNELFEIKKQIVTLDIENTRQALEVVTQIKGLGVAGASGLLSLIFPTHFGTVDQFVVKALLEVEQVKEKVALMNPERLSVQDGEILTQIIKEKASDNNRAFGTQFWTPRTLEMALWAYRS